MKTALPALGQFVPDQRAQAINSEGADCSPLQETPFRNRGLAAGHIGEDVQNINGRYSSRGFPHRLLQ